MSKSVYDSELREIRHKSKIVYSKHGILPFLDGSGMQVHSDGYIPGFQIFRLWPEISVIDDPEEISEGGEDV